MVKTKDSALLVVANAHSPMSRRGGEAIRIGGEGCDGAQLARAGWSKRLAMRGRGVDGCGRSIITTAWPEARGSKLSEGGEGRDGEARQTA